MLCSNCKFVEMRVVSVNGNMATHECKKCGCTIIEEIPKEEEVIQDGDYK